MNRPKFQTMLLGHPVIAVPVMLGGALLIWFAWQAGGDGTVAGLAALIVMCVVGEAIQRRDRYRSWKREWDALAPPAPRKQKRVLETAFVLLLFGVPLVAISAGSQQEPNSAILWRMMGCYAVILAPFTLFRLLRRGKRRTVRASKQHVTAIVARPLFATPTLPHAYQALPDHCRRVLAQRP